MSKSAKMISAGYLAKARAYEARLAPITGSVQNIFCLFGKLAIIEKDLFVITRRPAV